MQPSFVRKCQQTLAHCQSFVRRIRMVRWTCHGRNLRIGTAIIRLTVSAQSHANIITSRHSFIRIPCACRICCDKQHAMYTSADGATVYDATVRSNRTNGLCSSRQSEHELAKSLHNCCFWQCMPIDAVQLSESNAA